MKKNKRLFISIGVLLLIVLGVVTAILLYKQNDRQAILETTQEWARIEAIPDSAEITSIEKHGSPLTREFQVTFTASEEVIREWLETSPGTRDVTPVIDGTLEKYSINPGGGAQFAEITYNTETNEVFIRTYWS